ncbi:DUF982 domain-containing protein [Pseudaminobacter sp. NGMCC 1.201702]|uniref:DUF982 domain-containing protein n=1 Tax=Pseudaminobacter sp. NGMCC 1.201702 TaxID=3391825 RepID=UPI0039F10BE7
MDRLQFVIPVRIRTMPGACVDEVYSVSQALDLLIDWPGTRQGPIYQTALNACLAATVEEVPTEDARRAFVSFARFSNILAKDAPNAVSLTSDGDLRPMANK